MATNFSYVPIYVYVYICYTYCIYAYTHIYGGGCAYIVNKRQALCKQIQDKS